MRNTKKEARAKTLKKLSTVVERWITDYGAELDPVTGVVSFSVPRSKVKDRFARRKPSLKLDHVGRGMIGLGTVKREGNRVTFVLYLSKIEEEGGVVVNPKTAELKLHQKHLFRQGESWHREPWETLEGINVEEACPDGIGDARRVHVQGAFGEAIDSLRGAWTDCPNATATQAKRTTYFALGFDGKTSEAYRLLQSCYGRVHNTVSTLLATATV